MNKFSKGFTIIELIVVIAIIAVLSGVIISNVSGYQSKARDAQRTANVAQFQKALTLYYADHSYYLSQENNNYTIYIAYDNGHGNQLAQYISVLPVDPKTSASYQYYTGPVSGYGGHATWYAIFIPYENKTQCWFCGGDTVSCATTLTGLTGYSLCQ